MMNERLALIALHLTPGMGPRHIRALVERFGSAAAALDAPCEDLTAAADMTPALARALTRAAHSEEPEREIERARRAGASVVTMADTGYPSCLRTISDPPPVLSILGTLTSEDTAGIAIVGTRTPTAYGRSCAALFAREFAQAGLTVCSGLARGIDTEAHQAALAAQGRTVAYLGSGLAHIYPPENRKLADSIARCGAIISEFPMDAQPERHHFPRRNRLISAASLATLVVEARTGSGALITAAYAAEQGRDVFAVPGPVFSAGSAGPHSLIKAGARMAECARDILDEIAPLREMADRRPRAKAAARRPALPESRAQILDLITGEPGGMPLETIVRRSGKNGPELARDLLELELTGDLRALPGNIYMRASARQEKQG